MAEQHLCTDRPGYNPDTDDAWVSEPTLAACPHHDRRGRKQPYKLGRGDRRALDREAGHVGTDRGNFISGVDSGR